MRPDIVQVVVYSLGPGATKPGLLLQQNFLKWLIMVKPVLEKPSSLSTLYSVLFNLLDMIGLRSYLSHLLAMITKSKHVKPFRMRMLNHLLQKAPREPALEKLCQVYDQLSPGNFDVSLPSSKISFPYPDSVWGAQLQSIQEKSSRMRSPKTIVQTFEFPIHALDSGVLPQKDETYDVRDIRTTRDVAEQFKQVSLSTIGTHDLRHRPIQQVLTLRREDGMEQVNRVLSDYLERELEDLTEGEPLNCSLIEDLVEYTRHSKV